MAPNQHLTYRRIDKFGGLWDVKPTTLMPPHAAQVMSGCHPQVAGGLRAFFKPRKWTPASGLGRTGAKLRVIGAYPIEGNAFVVTAPADTTVTTDAVRPPNGEAKAYTTLSDGTGWTAATPGIAAATTATKLLFPSLGYTGGSLTPERQFSDRFTSIQQFAAAANGIYKMSEATGAFERMTYSDASEYGILAAYQARLIAAYESSVVFTAPGDVDLPTTGLPTKFINLGGRPVVWMAPMPPQDLIVGTDVGAIFYIQGDLDDPIVRQIRQEYTGSFGTQIAALTPMGPVAVSPHGPHVISTGGDLSPLAPGLTDDHFRFGMPNTGGFSLAMVDQFLFARSDGLYQNELGRRTRFLTTGNPDGDRKDLALVWPTDMTAWVTANRLDLNGILTFDTQSQAWFRSAHPDVATCLAPWLVMPNPGQEGNTERGHVLAIPTEEIDGTEDRIGWGHYSFGARQHTWEWKSAPMRSDSGRQVHLREVQLGAYGHTETGVAAANSTIVVTAENELGEVDSFTVNVSPGVSKVYHAPVRMDGTYVSVSLKAVSSDGAFVEAPTLEFISMGTVDGKTQHQKA